MTDWRDTTRARVRRMLPWVLLFTVAVNLGMSERFVPPSGHPIRTSPGPALSDLVRMSQPLTRDTYLLYVDLADVATGGTLTVPAYPILNHHLLRGLAGMTVERRPYDPQVGGGAFDLPSRSPGRVLTPAGVVPYWIVPGDAQGWWLARVGAAVVIVNEAVAPIPEERA